MTYYKAQIGGYTINGTMAEVQIQWDGLKAKCGKSLVGETFVIYKGTLKGGVFCCTLNPVFTETFNG